jgi:hypothetical protein
MSEKKAAKIVVAYELLRFFTLSLPSRPVRFLPASWYAAVPLLALPPILAVLSAFSGDGGGGDYRALKKLYALVKILSAVGIAAYIVSAVSVPGQGGALTGQFPTKQLVALLFFFFIDILLAARHKKNL